MEIDFQQERKHFFFGKKKQKTFIHQSPDVARARHCDVNNLIGKSFFRKTNILLLLADCADAGGASLRGGLRLAGKLVEQGPHAGGLQLNVGIVQQALNFVAFLVEILLGHRP